ncbi:hypothetical protein [Corynebacterium doosanense]|uniref:hypothetical protein n=1 Tax=Corynebacterium doosanense TaxID=1121358 RepID=UPI00039B8E99|nr:hypothetical protein [Corynebacterium doosanense]
MSADHRIPWRAPDPRLNPGVSPVLADLAFAAARAFNVAWSGHSRAELAEETQMGADGTPSYLIDEIVEEEIVRAAARHNVNVLMRRSGSSTAATRRPSSSTPSTVPPTLSPACR